MGDIQHMMPGVSFRTACYGIGVKAHTWPATACAGHSLGRKGMIQRVKDNGIVWMEALKSLIYMLKQKKSLTMQWPV